MRSIRAFLSRCAGQLFRSRRDRELDEEFESHLQLHIEDNLRAGMSPSEARRAALLKFTGGMEAAKEDYRDQRGIPMIENLLRDVRYTARTIRKSPAFTIISMLTIGIGVGATASMFSIADSLLFRPLPVVRPGELLTVRSSSPSSPSSLVSYRDYLDLRERNKSFQDLAAFASSAFGYSRSQVGAAQMKYGIYATSNLLPVLGIEPPLGRGFLPGEDKAPVRTPVVVLSHSFWKTEFASDPAIIGKSIRINGSEVTIVGVTPESFTGIDVYMRPAFYLPLGLIDRFNPDHRLDHRDNQFLMVKGRLKQGVSFLQARAELAQIASALQQAYPDTNRNRTATVRTELSLRIEDSPVDANLAQMLLLLAGCVLLVACANVAGLLLSRSRARSREIAVRLAIGSSRLQLIRQLLIESLLIALGGGVAGIAIGYAATLFFASLQVPSDLPIVIDIRIDQRAMLCALAAAMLSALLFGLAPAIRATRPNLVPALKSTDADLAGPRKLWGRNLLVVAQVALSLMLLTVSGFMYRGFARQMESGPGFRTDQLLMMSFNPNLIHQDDQQTRQFYRQLRDRVKQTPGVEQFALTQSVPFMPNQSSQDVIPEGFQFAKGVESINILGSVVSEGYFYAMKIPILSGRSFSETDDESQQPVVIVNQEFAQRYWPNQDPLNKRLKVGGPNGKLAQVIGVAKTTKYLWIGEPPSEYLYLPLRQHPTTNLTLLVRSAVDPTTLTAALREAVRSIDPNQPVFDVRAMSDFYAQRVVKSPTMIIQTVACLGFTGMLLAMIGLYGLIAYSVSRRTREIGLRMAIGAGRNDVIRMVLRQGVILTVSGICIGALGSFGLEHFVTALFSAATREAGVYFVTPLAFLAVTLFAAWLPARRASQVDPMRALREE